MIMIIIIMDFCNQYCLAMKKNHPKKRNKRYKRDIELYDYDNPEQEPIITTTMANEAQTEQKTEQPGQQTEQSSTSTEGKSFVDTIFGKFDSFYHWLDEYHHDSPKQYWITLFAFEIVLILIGYCLGRQLTPSRP
mgnify:CR=1 FL=1